MESCSERADLAARHIRVDDAEAQVIDNAELVDALDTFRQDATPAVLEWVANMAAAAKHYALHDGNAKDVAGFDALLELARVVAESGR